MEQEDVALPFDMLLGPNPCSQQDIVIAAHTALREAPLRCEETPDYTYLAKSAFTELPAADEENAAEFCETASPSPLGFVLSHLPPEMTKTVYKDVVLCVNAPVSSVKARVLLLFADSREPVPATDQHRGQPLVEGLRCAVGDNRLVLRIRINVLSSSHRNKHFRVAIKLSSDLGGVTYLHTEPVRLVSKTSIIQEHQSAARGQHPATGPAAATARPSLLLRRRPRSELADELEDGLASGLAEAPAVTALGAACTGTDVTCAPAAQARRLAADDSAPVSEVLCAVAALQEQVGSLRAELAAEREEAAAFRQWVYQMLAGQSAPLHD